MNNQLSKKIAPTVAAISFALLSQAALALELNQPLPAVEVTQRGETILTGEKITYQSWSSTSLTGKVRVVQHLAGRSSAKKINEALIDQLKAAKFNEEKYQTTTILNTHDAVWGTTAVVMSKAEKNKKLYPWSSIVVDDKGTVRSTWKLQEKSSAVAVLNQSGEVLFFKDGALTSEEVTRVIDLIKTHLN